MKNKRKFHGKSRERKTERDKFCVINVKFKEISYG